MINVFCRFVRLIPIPIMDAQNAQPTTAKARIMRIFLMVIFQPYDSNIRAAKAYRRDKKEPPGCERPRECPGIRQEPDEIKI